MGGKSADPVIIGYRYYLGMHLILCRKLDAILKIKVGNEEAWSGTVTSNQQIYIDKPNLHGGEERGGGVVGYVDVEFGGPTQGQNDYLQSVLGANIPAYRGNVGLVLRQPYLAAISPNPQPWAIEGRYTNGYAIVGATGHDINPAHLLYLLHTSEGLGLSDIQLNLDSFSTARSILAAEGLGVSFLFSRSMKAEDRIAEVLRHIDGFVFSDLETGKITLKLARAGEAPVMSLDETNLIEVRNFSRRTSAEQVNTVIVRYRDRQLEEHSVTLHNPALLQQQNGEVNAETRTYDGIAEHSVALMIAARDLRSLSAPLSTAILVGNRSLRTLRLGDVISFTWERYGVSNEQMRITQIDYGDLDNHEVTIQCQQDIYGIAESHYSVPPATGWVDPITLPAVADHRVLQEMPYIEWVRRYGESTAVWEEIDPYAGMLAVGAGRPSGDSYGYQLWSRISTGTYERRGITWEFAPTATIATAMVPEVTTTIAYTSGWDMEVVPLNEYAVIGTEYCEVTAINLTASTVTLKRGILDTVPRHHAEGTRIWFLQRFKAVDPTEYLDGETVHAKILPETGKGTLGIDSAPQDALIMDGRMLRPFPPGNLKFNGQAYPEYITGDLVVTWAHRDRLQQTGTTYYAQNAGDIGPEEGTTYRLRIYDENNTLRQTYAPISGTSQAYSRATEIADLGIGRVNKELRFVLDSVRDGVYSWDAHDLWIERRVELLYDGNTNTGGVAPVDGDSPYPVTATAIVAGLGTLEKEGYWFRAWNTEPGGGGTDYDPGDSITMNLDTTLYAQWAPSLTGGSMWVAWGLNFADPFYDESKSVLTNKLFLTED